MKHLKKTPTTQMEVLVTDGDTRAGLAVARSLARRDIPFLVLTENPACYSRYSRSVKHLLHAPSPTRQTEDYMEGVLNVIRRYGIQLVIPVSDKTLHVFNRFRNSLENQVKIALPHPDALNRVLNKRENLKLAKQLGIPCPKQFELNDLSQLPQMIEALGFPIVLKNPGLSMDPDCPSFDFRVLYAYSEEDLRRLIQQRCRNNIYPLFQECAQGRVHHYCCFAAKGEVLAVHDYQSVRRVRGEGVLRKIIPITQELEGHSRRLLKALEWDGVAHVEFFISNDKKRKWYIETNGRFWASTQGSVSAGWDFPLWIYEYFLHGKKPRPGPLELNSQTCWHLGDLTSLMDYYRGGHSPTPGTEPGKWKAFFQYISGFFPNVHADVFRWKDPLPSLMEHWHFFCRMLERMGRGKQKGDGPGEL